MAKNDDNGLGCLVLIVIGLIILGISGIRGCIDDNKREKEQKAMCETIIEINTDSAYISFLDRYKYSSGKYFEKVDSIFWERTLTSSDYTRYIENVRYGKYISAAKDSIDEILWRETIESSNYQNYLGKTAKKSGKYALVAKDSIEQIENRKWDTDIKAWNRVQEINTVEAYEKYIEKYPQGKNIKKADEAIVNFVIQKGTHNTPKTREIYNKYINNSLQTGTTPYRKYYGGNSNCGEWGCSQIKVKTPHNSDVLVTIKRSDKVVRHAYIRANSSYTFEMPNGIYQTFFYYGKGWTPEKEMKRANNTPIFGGFISDEVFGKDSPQRLDNSILEYQLILQRNGNFKTIPSNSMEAL